jgi:hypothetical protein
MSHAKGVQASSPRLIKGDDINSIIATVRGMGHNANEQLTILARALVVGCISCGVSKERALDIVDKLFDARDVTFIKRS